MKRIISTLVLILSISLTGVVGIALPADAAMQCVAYSDGPIAGCGDLLSTSRSGSNTTIRVNLRNGPSNTGIGVRIYVRSQSTGTWKGTGVYTYSTSTVTRQTTIPYAITGVMFCKGWKGTPCRQIY